MLNDPLSALSIDLAGHDATRPIAPDGEQPVVVTEVKVDDNKDKTGQNLVVSLANVNPITATNGKIIAPGALELNLYLPLQRGAKDIEKNTDGWKDRICLFVDAAFGTNQDNRPNLNAETVAAIKGRTLICDIGHEDTPQFGTQNRAGRVKAVNA